MSTSLLQLSAALLLAAPSWAAACDPARDIEREAASPTARSGSAAPPAAARTVPGFGPSAAPSQLAQARGGDGGIASDTTLGGVVSGNSATNVITGANSIQASSFAGASGIPIVIQNTGANVLIQNATVINLQLK